MSKISIRLIKNRAELDTLLEIRKIVFIKGQKVPVKRERDGLEDQSTHFIVLFSCLIWWRNIPEAQNVNRSRPRQVCSKFPVLKYTYP